MDNDNYMDDLFRNRLANKEMKVSNPNISFKQKNSSHSPFNNAVNSFFKAVKMLKMYQLIAIVTTSGIFIASIIYFSTNHTVKNNPKTVTTFDSLSHEKDTLLINDKLSNDTSEVDIIRQETFEALERIKPQRTTDSDIENLPEEEIQTSLKESNYDNDTKSDSLLENINKPMQNNDSESVAISPSTVFPVSDKPVVNVDTSIKSETQNTEEKVQQVIKNEEKKKKRKVKKLR